MQATLALISAALLDKNAFSIPFTPSSVRYSARAQ